MNSNGNFCKRTLAVACMCAIAGSASAQLEEIVVTATKRAETAQDIPMSIEAVTGERLSELGIVDFATLSDTVPNFFVADGVVTTQVTVRGMGSGGDRSFEQSVGMFIDNVYMPRSRQYRAPFFDAERVEVLRGPQAVLFGLNSTAGAVAVHTRRSRPGDEFSADVSAMYTTDYDGMLVSLAAGGSLTDSLAVRVAGQFEDSDGYWENDFTGENEGARESTLYRVSAVWEPTDRLTVDAKYEYSDFEQNGSHGELFGPRAAGLNNGDDKLNWRRYVDASLLPTIPDELGGPAETGLSTEISTFALNIGYELGEHTLTGIFGYSDTEFTFGLDLDSTAGGFFDPGSGAGFVDAIVDPEKYEQTSFELQLKSPTDRTLEYVLGAYYMESELSNSQPTIYGLQTTLDALVAPGACALFGLCGAAEFGTPRSSTDQEMFSVYGHLTFNLSDSLRLIGGVRYVDDQKDHARSVECSLFDIESSTVIGPGIFTCPTGDGYADSRSSDNVMPELALQWNMGDDSMLYAKVGTSAKSGGFAFSSSIVPESLEYEDEEVVGYELGYKGRFNDGMAEFNAVLFLNDYTDLQSNSFVSNGVSTSSIIGNADATTQGVELDGRVAATDWLILGASYAYLEAEWDDFEDGPCSAESGLAAPCDLSGRPLAYAPETTATLYADLTLPLGGSMDLVGNLTGAFSDEYSTDTALDSNGLQDSFWRVNARLGLQANDGKWSVSLIGRNLTDEAVLNVTQPFLGLYLGYIAAPRTVAVQATYRLGD